ncbi:hypothetical protein KAM333_38160 [Aeromonas caviae]|nr:hypothetical protein KAM333_38160 [Aeromonas caviae]
MGGKKGSKGSDNACPGEAKKTGEKDVGKPPRFARLSYLSLRFKIGEPSYRPTSI